MKKRVMRIAGGVLMMISSAVMATPTVTNVGVGAATGTVDCARTNNGGCAWLNDYATTGLSTHTAISGSSSVSDVRGSASAWGEANLTSYLPSLHAYATSNGAYTSDFSSLAGTRYRVGTPDILFTGAGSGIADANVWAVQGYEYTGSTPFDLTITGTLDSIFSSSGAQGKIGHAGFLLSVFSTDGYVFDPNDTSLASDSSTICPLFGRPSSVCAGGPTVYDSGRTSFSETGALSLTVGHRLNTGDKFYVGVFMDANVCCGLTADSSHTLNLAFNDFTQLASIPVAGVAAVVPEPHSAFLFMTGLALLAACLRKRSPTSSSV